MWDERKKTALRARAKIQDEARSWFKRHGFVEVQGPVIVPAYGQGLGYFEVEYFGRKAYLAHGLQQYAEVLVKNLGRVYTIAPVFRAEKGRTKRHLTEYWHIEAVLPRANLEKVMMVEEGLITSICQRLAEEAKKELLGLKRSIGKIRNIHPPFPRLTYDEAVMVLQGDGFNIEWGSTLGREHEEYLSNRFAQPFFITGFPVGLETLWCKSHPAKPELTLSADLLAPEGFGEISSGGQVITEKEEILSRVKPDDAELLLRSWTTPFLQEEYVPYSGFAMGIERITQWICRLESVEVGSAFPRLVEEFYS